MISDKLQLSLINAVKLRNPLDEATFPQDQAGFVKSGKYAWIVDGATIEVISTDNGNKIGHYNFNKHHSSRECIITHVEEVNVLPGVCLIAIAVDFCTRGPNIGMLSVLHVQGSKILGSMDFCEQITCIRYLPATACNKSVLRSFNGALAIGTNQGKLFLIDLMIPRSSQEINALPNYETEIFACMNVLANMEQSEIAERHQNLLAETRQCEKTFFAIQLEVLNDSGAILSMLVMPNLYTMAVGLNDGRMVLYDLTDLSAFHLAYPPSNPAPLTHMSFLEPTDDPRCAVYIWSFHCSQEGAVAVMHSLMFASKIEGKYEDFKACSVRLTLPVFEKNTFPICCQSITRHLTQDDEDILTLNVLAWSAPSSRSTNIMMFDLNQWYKEEMPDRGNWKSDLKYAAVFELHNCTGLHALVNPNSVYPFNSIMRPEEHFYPSSLSFDLCLLECKQVTHYRWVGLQNIVLQQFNVLGPQVVYEPHRFYDELLDASTYPQFSDAHYNKSAAIEDKREFLLSVALEYNFVGFLRRCANAWADGSYLGKDTSNGIGLSTLTDWIWNRVRSIKEVCNTLSKPLFDFSEQRIDYGTQKQLSHCCKQLKILSELLQSILRDYNAFIPPPIQDQLKIQSESIRMASDYQEILQWLLNVGLLPEGHYHEDEIRDHPMDLFIMDPHAFMIVPYPYKTISAHYKSQRLALNDDNSKFLFIDAFIEKECSSDQIYEMWTDSYPPKSIQSLLRILLIPDTPIQCKYVIFVYLFMDITKVLSETAYSSIVRNLIKFPAVFKMDPAIIKRTQAFWNLDNGKLEAAVEELISPLSHDKHIPMWQRELLIQVLLRHKEYSLALRALRCPGNQISPELEMSTLLDNHLLSEALRVQRATADKELLTKFFHKVLHSSNYQQLLDMRLTEEESSTLREYLKNLKNSGLPNHLNIHFVFLLQRSKFLDAAHLVESFNGESSMNMEPPKQVLNAYYASMEPTTRKITSLVYNNDVLAKDLPLPMSVNLIQAKCNATNNFFSKCVESITEASVDGADLPFVGSPKLGIFEYRQPQLAPTQDSQIVIDMNDNGKRKTVKDNNILSEDILLLPNTKKRRLNDSIAVPHRKSYMDMQVGNLTIFKDTKPDFNFTGKSPGNSSRASPERVRVFGNFLCTPIVNKKTPPKRFTDKCPPTPVSILKTRSMRGSLSPGRLSEFGDDNKSVKSITFAAMPDSRDTSFNESSNFEDTSAEAFYSPDNKSPRQFDGPKSRRPIGNLSHSNTPSPMIVNESPKPQEPATSPKPSPRTYNIASTLIKNLQSISNEIESFEKATNEEKERKIRLNESKSSDQILEELEKQSTTLNTTVEHDSSIEELTKPYRSGDVLKDDKINSDSSEEDSEVDQSYMNLTRHSVIESKYGDTSDSQDEGSMDEEEVHEEHYEEEQLPEHEDGSVDSEYGDVDLNDSSDIADYEDEEEDEEKENSPVKPKPKTDEVICLDSSDESSDSDVEIQQNLPAFTAFSQEPQKIYSQEEMCDMLYDDVEVHDEIVIEEQEFEDVIPMNQVDNLLDEEIEVPTSSNHEDPLELEQNVANESENVTHETDTFVSASGGDLNVALIDTHIDSTTLNEAQEEEATTVDESEATNVHNQAVVDLDVSVEETQDEEQVVIPEVVVPVETVDSTQKEDHVTADDQEVEHINTRSMRSRSASAARELRGQSVPTNASSSPKSTRSTRASTEERDKPAKRKNVITLEIIEETGTPVASPGMLTRKRSQLSLADSVETPTTPTVLTRRRSLLVEEAKSNPTTPSTPKRITRAVSKESLASQNETDDSSGLTRRGSLRKRATSASDNDDAKSTRSTRSTRKSARTPTSSVKSTPEKPSPSSTASSQAEETSLTNRRLTRKQMKVIEKSNSLLQNMSQESSKTTISIASDSDNESVTSETSASSSRASRKRKSSVKFKDSEAAKNTLPAILEESHEGGPSPSKIRAKRNQRK